MNSKIYRSIRRRVLREEKEKYSLDNLMHDGKSKGEEPDDLDQDELDMGIEVEMEHTKDKDIARKIALDHLTEFPDYYSRLAEMEDVAKEAKDEMQSESHLALKHFKSISKIRSIVRQAIMEEKQ